MLQRQARENRPIKENVKHIPSQRIQGNIQELQDALGCCKKTELKTVSIGGEEGEEGKEKEDQCEGKK